MAKVLPAIAAEINDPDLERAYWDKAHPKHDYAVRRAMEIFSEVYGDDGRWHPQRDVIRDDNGEIDWNASREAFEEFVQGENSIELAKRGITTPEIAAEDGGSGSDNGGEGERTLDDLKSDANFMRTYTDRYADGHEEAVAVMTSAYRASEAGE